MVDAAEGGEASSEPGAPDRGADPGVTSAANSGVDPDLDLDVDGDGGSRAGQLRPPITATGVAAVAAGALVGTALRWALATALGAALVPWGTLAANLSGAFLLGLLTGAVTSRSQRAHLWRLALGTGALGAYTTMSSLAVETDRLVGDGHGPVAAAYLVGTVCLGLAMAAGGRALGHRRRAEAPA